MHWPVALVLTVALAAQTESLAEIVTKAQAAQRAGRHGEAVVAWQQALARQPGDVRLERALAGSLTHLGAAAFSKRDTELAARYFQQADKLWPQQPPILECLAKIRFQQGRRDEARRYLDQLLALEPEHATGLALSGVIAAADDDRERASRLVRRAADQAPGRRDFAAVAQRLEREARIERDFVTTEVGVFRIQYAAGHEEAQSALPCVEETLRTAYAELERDLGQVPAPPVGVVLYTQAQYAAINVHAPHAAAVFDGKLRIAITGWRARKTELGHNLRHELAHAFLHGLHSDVPVWVHEGYAQLFEGCDPAAARARLRAHQSPLAPEIMAGPFVTSADADLVRRGYDQALVAVALLRQDRRKFAEVLQVYGRGSGSDAALIEVFGYGEAALFARLSAPPR